MIIVDKEEIMTNDNITLYLEKLGVMEKICNANTILIKPNFIYGSYAKADSHIVTNISFLREIVKFLLSLNQKALIYIAESDNIGYEFAYLKFENLKLPQILNLNFDEFNRVQLLDLSRDRLIRIQNILFKYFNSVDRQLWISEKLFNSDIIISLSNLKTHTNTGYSGACKNLFGCLPAFDKSYYHPDIHKVIHDLTLAIKPHINIVDAFYAMEKNGPINGVAINCGFRILSEDAVEADFAALSLVGLKPMKIKYLKYLSRKNKNKNYKDVCYPSIIRIKKPSLFVTCMNKIGLTIQKFGAIIEKYGDDLHACTAPIEVIAMTLRPLLLRFIDIETLKKIKKSIMTKWVIINEKFKTI